MAMSIVSMLLENGFNDLTCEASAITESEANSYTLESGAALMARTCAQELHEIFEVAVVETNEAALAAYMEGCSDVMESATYGAVFESADKSAGAKILELLKKMKDRVFAFFKNISAKISALITNYDKFYENNKEKMKKAEAERSEDVKVVIRDWNDNAIDNIVANLKAGSAEIGTLGEEVAGIVKASFKSKPEDANKDQSKEILDACYKAIKTAIVKSVDNIIPGLKDIAGMEPSTLNAECEKFFTGKGSRVIVANTTYVESILKNTKKSLADIKTAQKEFNAAYDKAIKAIKSVTDDASIKEKAGYSAYIHKATSAMSKIQTVNNAYASAGYRAMVARANEAKALCGVIISGNAGKRDPKAKTEKENKN